VLSVSTHLDDQMVQPIHDGDKLGLRFRLTPIVQLLTQLDQFVADVG